MSKIYYILYSTLLILATKLVIFEAFGRLHQLTLSSPSVHLGNYSLTNYYKLYTLLTYSQYIPTAYSLLEVRLAAWFGLFLLSKTWPSPEYIIYSSAYHRTESVTDLVELTGVSILRMSVSLYFKAFTVADGFWITDKKELGWQFGRTAFPDVRQITHICYTT